MTRGQTGLSRIVGVLRDDVLQGVGVWRALVALVKGDVTASPNMEDPQELDDWQPTEGRIGVCCSGGGIRSASYSLGALQALQDRGVLVQADYLASVSGGAYTAGAMTMVAGSDRQDLVWGPGVPKPFARGTPEEQHLRRHSDYLAPGLAGKVRLLSRLVLGMVLNLLVVGALVVVAGRLAGQLAAWLEPDLVLGTAAGGGAPERLFTFVGIGCVVTAGTGLLVLLFTAGRRLDESEYGWLVRLATVLLGLAAVVALVVFALPWAIDTVRGLAAGLAEAVEDVQQWLGRWVSDGVTEPDQPAGSDQRGTNTVATLAAIVAALGVPTLLAGALRTLITQHASKLGRAAAWLVAPLLFGWTWLAVADDAAATGASFSSGDNLAWLAVPVAVFAGLYLASDLTSWSMHPFYKRRLSEAFALERVADPAVGQLGARERDYDLPVLLSQVRPTEGPWPKLVVCAAANISDRGVAPPGRNAVSFTFEHDWVGGPDVGYMRTDWFEEALGVRRQQDATLPAAMAISGAAVSPSMGKMTIPSLRFLLGLVNARLGVWLPNPMHVAALHRRYAARVAEVVRAEAEQAAATIADGTDEDRLDVVRGAMDAAAEERATTPGLTIAHPRVTWLFRELLGWNRLRGRYLYVSDGGHWENLGLVELLRRGCTEIYCIDAAGDDSDTFFTIGEAIALARSELGVDIQLDPTPMRPPRPDPCCGASADREPSDPDGPGDGGAERGEGENEDVEDRGTGHAAYAPQDSVTGTIVYRRWRRPDGSVRPRTEGRIVFVKAAVTESDAWDVRAYKERDPTFPNHSLLAQMFADQTFESYRQLGYAAADRAVDRMA